jgi:Cns1/TTC4 Wheel domain
LVFIYPEFGQFDYVERMEADDTLIEAFSEIFSAGLPWDENNFYKDASKLVFAIKVNSSNFS